MKKDISPILEIKNLTISYGGDPVVEELFLSISAGSFIGLIGPNGAGKTSLLLTISGQFKPQSGTVNFQD